MGRWMEKAKAMEAAWKGGHQDNGGCQFTPGEYVLITDNLQRMRAGQILWVHWVDESATAIGWWYGIRDQDGRVSQTHESRVRRAG